jgi:hypothetical protein
MSTFWTAPRPPRERFDSVPALWMRAAKLFFEGFDYILGVMLVVGVPAAAATLGVETVLAPLSDGSIGSLLTIPVDAAVSSLFNAWLSGPLYFGLSIRLQEGAWPNLRRGLRFMTTRWLRLTVVLFVASLLFTIGLLAFVVPGLYLLVKLSLSDAAVILEPERPAIQRSWELSQHAPITIFLAVGPFLLATMLFTFGVDFDALRETPLLAFAVDWSRLLLLGTFPSLVTALLYGWVRSDEDAAAMARLE